ncbi:MAG: hypothetical protein OXT01_10570, partial [Rhodospirillaceae bacterium]|nr:hypothetical protein [Rhodospirillaceae bacterium]
MLTVTWLRIGAELVQADLNDLIQTAERLELLVRNGALPEARAMLSETLVSETADPNPDAISIHGGLAWLFDRLADAAGDYAYRVKANGYGQTALLLDPNDALALAVLPDREVELVAHNLLRHRKSVMARRLLERLRDRSASAVQLLALLDFVDLEKQRIQDLPPSGEGRTAPLMINAIVWGDAYLDALFAYGLPSLLAPGNLPAVARDREIIFDFYTRERDRPRIDSHPSVVAVKRFAKFRYNLIPEAVLAEDLTDAARWCAGAAQQCSALRAKQLGADLLFLCGSAVYSDHCLQSSYGFLAEGYKAVVCIAPRTYESRAGSELSDYAQVGDGRIEATAEGLSNFIVRNLHRHARACFIGPEAQTVSQNPVALFFRDTGGFVCRTYEPNPLIISRTLLSREIEIDYFTIDVRFISELLGDVAYDEVIKVATNAADGIAVTDVDYGDTTDIRDYGDIELSVATCASGVLLTATRESDLAFFRWALSHRYRFDGQKGADLLPCGDEEGATITALLNAVEKGQ